MKVLFLDCDGVVNCQQTFVDTAACMRAAAARDLAAYEALTPHELDRYLMPADPVLVARIADVCARTGARLVASSVWRSSMHRMRELFDAAAFHPDAATTRAYPDPDDQRRGTQIAEWLQRHPEVTRWAIVDDDGDMLPEQRAAFVQTSFLTGVQSEHVERLCAILGGHDDT